MLASLTQISCLTLKPTLILTIMQCLRTVPSQYAGLGKTLLKLDSAGLDAVLGETKTTAVLSVGSFGPLGE